MCYNLLMIEQTLDNTGNRRRSKTTIGRSMLATSSTLGKARALFLAAALLSFTGSVALYFSGEESGGIFVGLWVPSILAFGAFIAPLERGR